MISSAIGSSPRSKLTLAGIYDWITVRESVFRPHLACPCCLGSEWCRTDPVPVCKVDALFTIRVSVSIRASDIRLWRLLTTTPLQANYPGYATATEKWKVLYHTPLFGQWVAATSALKTIAHRATSPITPPPPPEATPPPKPPYPPQGCVCALFCCVDRLVMAYVARLVVVCVAFSRR